MRGRGEEEEEDEVERLRKGEETIEFKGEFSPGGNGGTPFGPFPLNFPQPIGHRMIEVLIRMTKDGVELERQKGEVNESGCGGGRDEEKGISLNLLEMIKVDSITKIDGSGQPIDQIISANTLKF
uniref:Uncharacterized protein n=1 Tax=Parascaris equorum TaxID=6256 RepID=A0A914S497_PAREQ